MNLKKNKIITVIILLWAQICLEAEIQNTDSLENSTNSQIKNNSVQYNTLQQLYKLITIYTYKNPVKALQYSFSLEYYSKKLNSQYDLAAAYNKIGLILFNQNMLDDALFYYDKSFNLNSKNNNSSALAYTLNDIGNVYYYLQKGDSSVNKYFQAADIFKKINNSDGLALSYNNLGFYYNNNHEYDKAILYLTKALELRKNLKDSELVAHSYEFIGTFYSARREFDSAEVYFKNALNIFSKEDPSIHIFECLSSYSYIYITKGFPLKYILNLLDTYDINSLIKAFPQGVDIFYNIGKTYFYHNKIDDAKYFLNLSVENAKKYKDDLILSNSYFLLSEIESKLNNQKLAFAYYKEYSQLKDSVFNFSTSKILKDMVQRYNTISAENEISDLEKVRDYDNNIILISGIFLFVLFIGIIIIFKNSRDKAKFNYLLNSVINSLTHPFILINVDNFEIVLANKAAYSNDVNFLDKEKLNKCYYSVCRLDDSCNHYGMICPVTEIQDTLRPLITEHRYVNLDKKIVFREIHAFPLFDKRGNLTMVIEYMFDITDRKKLEEDLKKFFVAVEHAPSDIVITNKKGLIEYVNPHFHQTTGYSFKEVKGKNPRILKSGKMSKEFIKNLWETILAGKVWFGDFIDKNKDGSFYWESARIAPILDSNNNISHFIKVSEDISARKLAEEQLKNREHQLREANAAKDKLLAEIAIEREKSEKLLLNILPASIADRLKAGEENIADHFNEASVIFVDLNDFTQFSSKRTPEEVVKMLNEIFTKFDKISAKYGIEKIKTIGDNYMAAAGIPMPNPNHAELIAKMAIEIMESMKDYRTNDGNRIKVRMGLHCGPVAAGVIGEQKFIYDLWGDTVNIASRMESSGENEKIQCSQSFKEKITDFSFNLINSNLESNTGSPEQRIIKFKFIERGIIEIKGKGKMRTYFLEYD